MVPRPAEKTYVQHRLKETALKCGSGSRRRLLTSAATSSMAKDVHRALIEIAIEHGGTSEDDATHFIENDDARAKRYLQTLH